MGIFQSIPRLIDSKMIYDCVPDKPDDRDFKKFYDIHHCIKKGHVKRVDLRDKCPSVYNQENLGGCTANAICGYYSYIYMQENDIKQDEEKFFSRLFVYWNERAVEGITKTDSSASIRDGIKSVHKKGVCLEEYWPYVIKNFDKKPSEEAFLTAHYHVAIKYHRILNNLHQLKQCLLEGDPFVFGFLVYESFESEEVAKTGMMTMPKENEKLLGGHAVMAVGFDDDKQCFIVRNSWGPEWGLNGYFYMPYDFMFGSPSQHPELPTYTSDHWVIEVMKDTSDE